MYYHHHRHHANSQMTRFGWSFPLYDKFARCNNTHVKIRAFWAPRPNSVFLFLAFPYLPCFPTTSFPSHLLYACYLPFILQFTFYNIIITHLHLLSSTQFSPMHICILLVLSHQLSHLRSKQRWKKGNYCHFHFLFHGSVGKSVGWSGGGGLVISWWFGDVEKATLYFSWSNNKLSYKNVDSGTWVLVLGKTLQTIIIII